MSTPQLIYQLFPLGVCGALADSEALGAMCPGEHPRRLRELVPFIDHAASLSCDTILLGPVFSSSTHGYDTVDPRHVDARLGDDSDLVDFVAAAHARGVKVVVDAVFNHVGRQAAPFRALQADPHGPWRQWFHVREGRSPDGDAFDYDGWGGHHSLPRLNTDHDDVRAFWADVVRGWYRRFDIDGLRLDAADCLSPDFVAFIADVARAEKAETWLVGEVVHGDYRERLGPRLLDSVTNYELYKGLWSGVETRNLFEPAWSLDRQSGDASADTGLYRDERLMTFVDNHDVKRLASTLTKPASLYPTWGLLMTSPGVPCIYAGSEFAFVGEKTATSDTPVRPCMNVDGARAWAAEGGPAASRRCDERAQSGAFVGAAARDLEGAIARLARMRADSPALREGDYEELFVADTVIAFRRAIRPIPNPSPGGGREQELIVVVNVDDDARDVVVGRGVDRGDGDLGARAWDHGKGGHCRGVDVADGEWVDVLNDHEVFLAADGRVAVTVPAMWLRVLQRRP